MVGSVCSQKLPFVVLRSEAEIGCSLLGELFLVDSLDEAEERHAPRVVVVIAWNTVKEQLSFCLRP